MARVITHNCGVAAITTSVELSKLTCSSIDFQISMLAGWSSLVSYPDPNVRNDDYRLQHNYWIGNARVKLVRCSTRSRNKNFMAETDILEVPLLQATLERSRKALREVNKARWFQHFLFRPLYSLFFDDQNS